MGCPAQYAKTSGLCARLGTDQGKNVLRPLNFRDGLESSTKNFKLPKQFSADFLKKFITPDKLNPVIEELTTHPKGNM
jgi:hypothetical protein